MNPNFFRKEKLVVFSCSIILFFSSITSQDVTSKNFFFDTYKKASGLFLKKKYQSSINLLHQIERESIDIKKDSYVFYLLGKNYRALKNYSLALFYFKEYNKYNPQDLNIYIDMSLAYLEIGNIQVAYLKIISYLNLSKDEESVHPKIYNLLSRIYLLQNNVKQCKKYIAKAKLYSKINEKYKQDEIEALLLESRLYLNLGKFLDSENSLKKIIEYKKNSFYILNYAGYYYEQYAKFLFYKKESVEIIYNNLKKSKQFYLKAKKLAKDKKDKILIQKNLIRLENVQ